MKKHLVAALLVVAMAVPAVSHAVDLTGKWGVGYFRPEAPIGVRIWTGDKMGIDLGAGFTSNSPDVGKSTTSYNFDLGLPYVIANTDNALFFLRPGFGYSSNGVDKGDGNAITMWNVAASLGVEYFFTPHFSAQVAHGVYYASENIKNNTGATNVDETNTSFASEAFGISNIGFHYYFGTK